MSKTVPVYKKGQHDSVTSYRPISLIPVIAKVFEALMLNQLYNYFEQNNLLVLAQHGFRRGRSTVTAVETLLQTIIESFETKCSTAVVLCDLSRAFECVSHNILLMKLRRYGLTDSALRLIQSYLADRSQIVSWQGLNSSSLPVMLGVPQGSILGPFLFIVAMNDLCFMLKEGALLYADDTTLYTSHKDPIMAVASVNNLVYLASEWFASNRLVLNQAKTQQILFNLNRNQVDDDVISTHSVKLLGFNLDSELCWSDHLVALCTKLSRVLFLLRRLKAEMPSEFVRLAYFAFFQSHLLYGTRLWGHSSRVQMVLQLQKKAVRLLSNAHYTDHCKPLFVSNDIMTVVNVYVFQCLMCIKERESKFPVNNDIHAHKTRNNMNIHVNRQRLTKTSKCFPITGVTFFNLLPVSVRNLPVTKLKNVLKTWLLKNPFYSITEFAEADHSSILMYV